MEEWNDFRKVRELLQSLKKTYYDPYFSKYNSYVLGFLNIYAELEKNKANMSERDFKIWQEKYEAKFFTIVISPYLHDYEFVNEKAKIYKDSYANKAKYLSKINEINEMKDKFLSKWNATDETKEIFLEALNGMGNLKTVPIVAKGTSTYDSYFSKLFYTLLYVKEIENWNETNEYKEKFIESLNMMNKSKELNLEKWSHINLNFENFSQMCISAFLIGLREADMLEYFHEDFESNLYNNFILNTEIALRNIKKDTVEDITVTVIEEVINDSSKVEKIVTTFIDILVKINFISIKQDRHVSNPFHILSVEFGVILLNEYLKKEKMSPMVISPKQYKKE